MQYAMYNEENPAEIIFNFPDVTKLNLPVITCVNNILCLKENKNKYTFTGNIVSCQQTSEKSVKYTDFQNAL